MSHNYATDIMALILRLEKRKLSRKVKTIFESAEQCRTYYQRSDDHRI